MKLDEYSNLMVELDETEGETNTICHCYEIRIYGYSVSRVKNVLRGPVFTKIAVNQRVEIIISITNSSDLLLLFFFFIIFFPTKNSQKSNLCSLSFLYTVYIYIYIYRISNELSFITKFITWVGKHDTMRGSAEHNIIFANESCG